MKIIYEKQINIILGSCIVLIIGIILGTVFSSQNSPPKNDSEISKTLVDTSKYYEQAELDTCLKKAEENFTANFKLNSNPAPQEGYPDARVWNDTQIKDRTEDNLRKDKEICIQLYK